MIIFYFACTVAIFMKNKQILEWLIILNRLLLLVILAIYLYYIYYLILIAIECEGNCTDKVMFFVFLIILSYAFLIGADLSLNQYDSAFRLYEEAINQQPGEYQNMSTINQV